MSLWRNKLDDGGHRSLVNVWETLEFLLIASLIQFMSIFRQYF